MAAAKPTSAMAVRLRLDRAHPHRVAGLVQQQGVELRAAQRHRGGGYPPGLRCDRPAGQGAAARGAELVEEDLRADLGDRLGQPHLPQRHEGVVPQHEPAAGQQPVRLGPALQDGHLDTGPAQADRGVQAADPGSDHDGFLDGHGYSPGVGGPRGPVGGSGHGVRGCRPRERSAVRWRPTRPRCRRRARCPPGTPHDSPLVARSSIA